MYLCVCIETYGPPSTRRERTRSMPISHTFMHSLLISITRPWKFSWSKTYSWRGQMHTDESVTTVKVCDVTDGIYFKSHIIDTYLVRHHSHLRLLALSSLPIGLGRSLGLISTGHDCCVERGKHSEQGNVDGTNLSCVYWCKSLQIENKIRNTKIDRYRIICMFCVRTHLQVNSVCVYRTCLCVRCLQQASLKMCTTRSAPFLFICWRP